jgi:hypothetical protein
MVLHAVILLTRVYVVCSIYLSTHTIYTPNSPTKRLRFETANLVLTPETFLHFLFSLEINGGPPVLKKHAPRGGTNFVLYESYIRISRIRQGTHYNVCQIWTIISVLYAVMRFCFILLELGRKI